MQSPWLKLVISGRKRREMLAARKDPNPVDMGGHSVMAHLVLDGEDPIPAVVETFWMSCGR